MKLQRARKDHTCGACGKKIPKGDRYWNDYDEQSESADKTHINCDDYDKRITAQSGEERWEH